MFRGETLHSLRVIKLHLTERESGGMFFLSLFKSKRKVWMQRHTEVLKHSLLAVGYLCHTEQRLKHKKEPTTQMFSPLFFLFL